MKLGNLFYLRGALLRWWLRNLTPTRWIRHFIYLLGALIFVLGGTAVGILRIQANEVNRLAVAIVPAVDANGQVLQAMTDAGSGLLGYQASHNLRLLTAYRAARVQTMAALATLQDKFVLLRGHDAAENALDADLEGRQRLALQQWRSYALSTEQAVTRGDRIDTLQGVALFDSFRLANAALGERLKIERDQALSEAQTISAIRMKVIIAATLGSLVATLILGLRYSRSVSQPITGLRDTMARQREGDLGARAREDHGSVEIRSLAIDFNALAEENLIAQRRVEDVNTHMASLVDLSLALGEELSLHDLLIRIVESARQMLNARYAALGVLDVTRTGLVEFVTAGLSPEEKVAIGEFPHGLGLLGVIIDDPQALRLEHLADDPRSVGFPPHHPPMDSFLGVPIVIRGEVFGNLYLTDKTDGPFTAEDERIVFAFALQAAVAVENVRRYTAERQRANMLENIHEIESAIRTASGIQQSLDVLCVALGEKLGVDRVIVKVGDSDRNLLASAQWHLSSVEDLLDDLVPYIGPLAEELWRSSGHLVVDDLLAPQKQSQQGQIFHGYTDARATIIVPIGLGDRVIGVIYVVMVHQPRKWTEFEVNVVKQVTAFVARVVVEAESQANQSEYIERLERLERQKTNFVETVSHELRTPLTSITGYLEVLRDGYSGELTEEQQQMLEVMNRNTNRLRDLIEDLLVLSQNESDSPKVDVVKVSMCELIVDTCQELTLLAQSRAIEFDIESDPQIAIVRGDKGQLQSAVVNIISNAIKFSHRGGVVTIRCTLDEDTRQVRFTCQDRGIGISADDQQQLFTRFFRAGNAMDQVIPGTGLGLNIVKQIIEAHGGQVRLVSVEGEGTTVIVDLPLSAPVPF